MMHRFNPELGEYYRRQVMGAAQDPVLLSNDDLLERVRAGDEGAIAAAKARGWDVDHIGGTVSHSYIDPVTKKRMMGEGESMEGDKLPKERWVEAPLKKPYRATIEEAEDIRGKVERMAAAYNDKRLKTQHAEHGTKETEGKPRVDLVPYELLEAAGRGFALGEEKYGRNNWRKGIAATKTAGAVIRHLYKWLGGEEVDSESGLHHFDHAAASLAMLIATVEHKSAELDDRQIVEGMIRRGMR